MRNVFLPAFLFLLTLSAQAQTIEPPPCPLTDSPAVFGFRLGMTQRDVQTVVGKNFKFKPKKSGTRSFFQNFIKKPAPPLLRGVRALYLRFFENQLYQIEIFYEERADWKTLEDFRRSFLAERGLSDAFWENSKGRTSLKCAGFTLVADKILGARIELTDEKTQAKFTEEQLREKNKGKS